MSGEQNTLRAPGRVQMSRQRPWRAEHPGAVIVARPSIWGNPYRVVRVGKTMWQLQHDSRSLAVFRSRSGVEAREEAVQRLRRLVERDRAPWSTGMIRRELAGVELACWCPLEHPCHADLLLEIANTPAEGAE